MRSFIVLLTVAMALADNCPKSTFCRLDEKPCPMGLPGPDGCPAPTMCIPAKVPSTVSGNGMCDNPCPTNCLPKDMMCKQGPDAMGCQKGDQCYPAPDPKDLCPKTCPVVCGPNEVTCYGKSSGNCPGSAYCAPKGRKINIEYECPGFCPADCGPNEIQCRRVDDKGCELPGQCIPATSPDKNGKPTCPNYCPQPVCKENETLCPGQADENGCKGPDTCVPRMMGSDNRLCPGFCPTTCPPDSFPCGGMDANDCMTPTVCVPNTYPSPSGNGTCPGFCPIVSCRSGYILCSGQPDPSGCKGMDFCQPIQYGFNGAACTTKCPQICAPGTFQCPNQYDDNGCQNPGVCVSNWDQCNIKG